jgi:hypothetical protein
MAADSAATVGDVSLREGMEEGANIPGNIGDSARNKAVA